MSINDTIANTIAKEGGYSDHPADKGGPTRWGITQAVARANGYSGDMRSLARETAVSIYRQVYAIRPGFAAVAEVSPAVGEELFDTGVNMGPGVPALWFQMALNGLNDSGKLYADIREDGAIGPGTIAAFRAYLKARGPEAVNAMLKALNGLQCARYIELARTRSASESFLYGWLRTRVSL